MDTTAQSRAEVEPEAGTVPELLLRNATEYGSFPAVTDGSVPGERTTLTWSQLRTEVSYLSMGLAEHGLRPGDRLVIMSATRPEHWVADLAAVHRRAVPCTAYATLSSSEVRYIARHSAATVAVLEGEDQLARWLPVLDELPALRRVVVIDAAAMPAGDDRFVSWADLRERGRAALAADRDGFEREWRIAAPHDPVCIIYTSGTTGNPKGVVLSHRNVLSEAAVVRALQEPPEHPDVVSYLPLAHIAGRELDIYLTLSYAGHVFVCRDTTAVLGSLREVRPPTFFGVPRVWEKIVAGVRGSIAAAGDEQREAFERACELSRQVYRLRAAGKQVPHELQARAASADERVLLPVRRMLGFDRMTHASSGAAPIPYEVLEFLIGIGVEVFELWGMSETSGMATTNTPEAYQLGSVGQPAPGVDVTTGEDGEVFVRGPIVFLGYLAEDGSVEDATDVDGWFATGDIGTIDDDGFLTITDRKKELIITAGGKNVPPTKLENLLTAHPLIGNAAAIGDGRPYLTALIVLDEEATPQWAARNGVESTDLAELAKHPDVLAELDRAVAAANEQLARVEQIKYYHVVGTPWSPESGELTPTLKLRRRVISERYRDTIEELYTQPPVPVSS